MRNFILILFVCLAGTNFLTTDAKAFNAAGLGERLVNEGKALEEEGRYEEALAKYQQALQPRYCKFRTDEISARGSIRDLYIKWGKYEEARQATNWFTKGKKELKIATKEAVWEVDALIDYQKTGNPQKIIQHIEHLKKQYVASLPPNPWTGYTPIVVTKILYLYNLMGDHDDGIKFIDECMEFFKQQDIKKYGVYKPGHADEEYLKIREGFEQDKAESFKGCAGKKPGEVCMGRATKALIESDYFPW